VTTIRAHPPVETPAGLVVALPPEFSGEGVGSKIGETDSNRPTAGRNAGTDPTVPDVFALADADDLPGGVALIVERVEP
jgi:hypothetical protein